MVLQRSSLTAYGRGCDHCGCPSTLTHSSFTASRRWNVSTTCGTLNSPRYKTLLDLQHDPRFALFSLMCTPSPVSTGMGDRVWFQLSVRENLSRYITDHPGQLSLAIPLWVVAMSTSDGYQPPLGKKTASSV